MAGSRLYSARPAISIPSSSEIGEPASWLLAIAAMAFALEGPRLASIEALKGPVVIGVFIGFVLHELAHRQVARRYGASASFVATPLGLAATFISGFLPFAILAPGYVKVTSWSITSVRGLFYSVAAGPATNIALSLAFYAIAQTPGLEPRQAIYALTIAKVNAYIALFNLLPIDPLDGAKIARYDARTWAAMLATSILLYIII